MTGWWFGTFFIFPYIGNSNPNWLIFQRGWNHQPVEIDDFNTKVFSAVVAWRLWATVRGSWSPLQSMDAVTLLMSKRGPGKNGSIWIYDMYNMYIYVCIYIEDYMTVYVWIQYNKTYDFNRCDRHTIKTCMWYNIWYYIKCADDYWCIVYL